MQGSAADQVICGHLSEDCMKAGNAAVLYVILAKVLPDALAEG